MKRCKRGHTLGRRNSYVRSDGKGIECKKCRAQNLKRHTSARPPLTFEAVFALKKKFLALVNKTGEHHLFTSNDAQGYGLFRIGYHTMRANRVALALKLGRLVNGFACHTCDVPLCCRPSHLYEGTPQSNVEDRVKRGRSSSGSKHWTAITPWKVSKGERSGMAKLSDSDVDKIRVLYMSGRYTQAALGRRFGVSQVQVSNITSNKSRVK